MMSRIAYLGVCSWLVVFAAGCGGEEHAPSLQNKGGTGGKGGGSSGSGGSTTGGSGGSGGSTDGGGMGGVAGVPAGNGPNVEVTKPTEATDPNTDPIVTGNKVDIVCKVTKSTDPDATDVDPATVKLEVLDATSA